MIVDWLNGVVVGGLSEVVVSMLLDYACTLSSEGK